jgi:hypothetical protein
MLVKSIRLLNNTVLILVGKKINFIRFITGKNEKTLYLFLNVILRFQLIIFNFSNYNGKENFLQPFAWSDMQKSLLKNFPC